MFGPDVIASVMPDELRQLVEGIRFIEAMKDSPVDKDALPESVTSLRAIFTKSVVAARSLEAGALLGEADLAIKKPGTGIPGSERPSLVGRRLRRAVVADQLLHEDDFE
jgi:N-acetylneuraminate synthase